MRDLCPDCGVAIGVAHEDGCDIARCLAKGMQRLQCGGEEHQYKGRWFGEHEGSCGYEVWAGESGDVRDARELGFWCYWEEPPPGGRYGRFVPCDADHPEATEDLNRLIPECNWDREQQKWVPR